MADPTSADPAIPRPQLVLRLLEIANATAHDEVRRAALAEIAAVQNSVLVGRSHSETPSPAIYNHPWTKYSDTYYVPLLGADLVERANAAASIAGGSVDISACFGEPGYRVPGGCKP